MKSEREHREIERKFLVRELPGALSDFSHAQIAQGYLAITAGGVQVRLRKAGPKLTLTFKRGNGEARTEREIELSAAQFEVLWPATEGCRLTKTRYEIPWADHIVELDVYGGRHEGLLVAEVEFRDEESAKNFQPPAWLGADVTHEARYSNQRLAADQQNLGR